MPEKVKQLGWIVLCTTLLITLPDAVASAAVQGAPPQPQAADQAALLRAQLETVREYQDRFIAIVLWALGTVLAVALGLTAFSWYSNKTTYERDREAVRHEREALRQELRALVAEETRRSSQELTATLTERQTTIQQAVAKTLDPKLEKLNEQLTAAVGQIMELTGDALRREAEDAVQKKSYAWAIYNYCRHLDVSVKRGSDHYEVGGTLDEIRKILDTPGVLLRSDDVTSTVEALQRLPQRYRAAAELLVRRVKAAQG